MLAAGSMPAAAIPTTESVTVVAGDVAETRPVSGGGWWKDEDAGQTGTFEITKDSFDGSIAAKLGLPSNTAKVYLYHDYPADERPTDLLEVLEGASYTYTGTNVNFQVELVFLPTDVATYGAQGTTACTSALDWGLSDDPDACYTVMKWEPFAKPSGTWKTVDLTQDIAANSSTQTGGWISQKRLGSFAGPGVFIGQTLATYLAQIDSLEITSMVFGTGSATPGPVAGWVRDVTFDGVTYDFGFAPDPPAPPPAGDTQELEELIEDEGIDVEADTEQFFTTGESNTDLNRIDPNLPVSGTYENWPEEADDFVDVYSYSTAAFVGTFPIVGGNAVLSGMDLRHLAPGTHFLLLRGQSSGAIAVVQLNVLATALPATGPADATAPLLAGALMLLIGGAVVVTVRRAARR